MPKKVLVTQEFHRKALVALEEKKVRDLDLSGENIDVLRNAWVQYMEEYCTAEQVDHFAGYCNEYLGIFDLN
tara:strand:+ start:6072 stop:6287 length:216 start_codon:yes stop_codon:yes gene_type:complete